MYTVWYTVWQTREPQSSSGCCVETKLSWFQSSSTLTILATILAILVAIRLFSPSLCHLAFNCCHWSLVVPFSLSFLQKLLVASESLRVTGLTVTFWSTETVIQVNNVGEITGEWVALLKSWWWKAIAELRVESWCGLDLQDDDSRWLYNDDETALDFFTFSLLLFRLLSFCYSFCWWYYEWTLRRGCGCRARNERVV